MGPSNLRIFGKGMDPKRGLTKIARWQLLQNARLIQGPSRQSSQPEAFWLGQGNPDFGRDTQTPPRKNIHRNRLEKKLSVHPCPFFKYIYIYITFRIQDPFLDSKYDWWSQSHLKNRIGVISFLGQTNWIPTNCAPTSHKWSHRPKINGCSLKLSCYEKKSCNHSYNWIRGPPCRENMYIYILYILT